jgi:hypothetical protein
VISDQVAFDQISRCMAAYDEPALTSHTISTFHLGTSNCNRLCRIEKPAEVTCRSPEAVLDLDKQIECRVLISFDIGSNLP